MTRVAGASRPAPTYRERARLHDAALRALIRAAAGLTEGNLAFALLETGVALHRIAELDWNEAAKDDVLKALEYVKAGKGE